MVLLGLYEYVLWKKDFMARIRHDIFFPQRNVLFRLWDTLFLNRKHIELSQFVIFVGVTYAIDIVFQINLFVFLAMPPKRAAENQKVDFNALLQAAKVV